MPIPAKRKSIKLLITLLLGIVVFFSRPYVGTSQSAGDIAKRSSKLTKPCFFNPGAVEPDLTHPHPKLGYQFPIPADIGEVIIDI